MKIKNDCRKHIYFKPELLERLEKHINTRLAGGNVLSSVVNQAVEEYLDRQEKRK
jgi:hypothetical protein